MPRIEIHPGSEIVDLEIDFGHLLRLTDDDFFDLCSQNPLLQIERSVGGDLIVKPLPGWDHGRRNAAIVAGLKGWAEQNGQGVVSDSSAGFLLPSGAIRAPDASWVMRSRVAEVPEEQRKRFLPLEPDFVIELRSPSDTIAALEAKMAEYRDCGVRLGWLIDPEERQVHVYRPGRPAEIVDEPSEISADSELPGFILDLAPIFEPV